MINNVSSPSLVPELSPLRTAALEVAAAPAPSVSAIASAGDGVAAAQPHSDPLRAAKAEREAPRAKWTHQATSDAVELAKIAPAVSLTARDLLPAVRTVDGKRVATGHDGVEKPVVALRDWDAYKAAATGGAKPNTIYTIEGKFYETDQLSRPVASSGRLTIGGPSHRLSGPPPLFGPDTAIGRAGLSGDIGFHHGGDQFGFGGGRLNLTPASSDLNSGEYLNFEMFLKRQVKAGHDVDASFQALFTRANTSQRPNGYAVQFSVDGGAVQERAFFNPRPASAAPSPAATS